jgi:hypothetical protein
VRRKASESNSLDRRGPGDFARIPITASLPKVAAAPSLTIQRKCTCGAKTHGEEECVDCKKRKEGRAGDLIHPKLIVGAVDDPLEHEADRVADFVLSHPAPRISPAAPKASPLTPTSGNPTGPGPSPASILTGEAASVLSQAGPGRPLPTDVRTDFESRFGQDFSHVRLHTSDAATRSAHSFEARAYTLGSHIVFGSSEYQPDSPIGKRLLAHELTHVVQQGTTGAKSHVKSVTPRIEAANKTQIQRQAMPDPSTGSKENEKVEKTNKERWPINYETQAEAERQRQNIEKKGIKTEGPVSIEQRKKTLWTFDFFRLAAQEAEAAKVKKEAELGDRYVVTLKNDDRVGPYVHFRLESPCGSPLKSKGTISTVSWGETGGLYPTSADKEEPERWDSDKTCELLKARRAVHEVGKRNKGVHRANPNLKKPGVKRVVRFHYVQNFPTVDIEIADSSVQWFYLSNTPDGPKSHLGLTKPSKIVKSYGPFFNVGGGDAKVGSTWLHFYALLEPEEKPASSKKKQKK